MASESTCLAAIRLEQHLAMTEQSQSSDEEIEASLAVLGETVVSKI